MSKITMVKQENGTVREGFDLFVRKCKVKNLTQRSIDSYVEKTAHFFEYVGEECLMCEVTHQTVDDYIMWLHENTQANDITINSYLRAVRAFLYYCMECGYVKNFKIHLIKAEKKLKETYTNEELQRLLEKPDTKNCSFSMYKTWVFENYLLATGNRLSTALNLKIEDIDFENMIIVLRKTKNRRQQMIPLSECLAAVMKEYMITRGGTGTDYVFCDEYGEQAKESTYRQLVRRYNIKRNVNKTSCHTFRHTFAKQWILAGGDIFRLQKILGHSDLTVTKEYVQMFGQDLQTDFERFNPLDRMQKREKTVIKMTC